jgi:hypothetical protein
LRPIRAYVDTWPIAGAGAVTATSPAPLPPHDGLKPAGRAGPIVFGEAGNDAKTGN